MELHLSFFTSCLSKLGLPMNLIPQPQFPILNPMILPIRIIFIFLLISTIRLGSLSPVVANPKPNTAGCQVNKPEA